MRNLGTNWGVKNFSLESGTVQSREILSTRLSSRERYCPLASPVERDIVQSTSGQCRFGVKNHQSSGQFELWCEWERGRERERKRGRERESVREKERNRVINR